MPTESLAHNVAVILQQEGEVAGYRVLDLRTELRAMLKELSFRTLGIDPKLAGEPWTIHARLPQSKKGAPGLILEAHRAAPEGNGKPLAEQTVAATSFAPVASSTAVALGLEGTFTYQVVPLEPSNPLVVDWQQRRRAEQTDFVFEDRTPKLQLPDGFAIGQPPGRLDPLHDHGTWLVAVLAGGCEREFFEAARAEESAERAWIGTGRTYLTPEACYVVIDELIETEGEGDWASLLTSGRQVEALRRQLGERRQAYFHLHPPYILDNDGQRQEVTPHPSPRDVELATNFDRVPMPTVYPICLFGSDAQHTDGAFAVHGFQSGELVPVTTVTMTE